MRLSSYLGLLALLEESLLTLLLVLLLPSKVVLAASLLDHAVVHTGNVYLCPCCNDVASVDPSERDTVDLERAGDEKDTFLEGLEQNDTLAAEASSEENQDSAWGEG